MANTASAQKEIRKGQKRALANLRLKRQIKDLTKKSMKAMDAKAPETVELVKSTLKALDKAAQKGIMKKNTVARKKSQLTRALNASVK